MSREYYFDQGNILLCGLSNKRERWTVHSCVALPPTNVRSFFREWFFTRPVVELELENRRSWHSFICRRQIRGHKHHKMISSDSTLSPRLPRHWRGICGGDCETHSSREQWWLFYPFRTKRWSGEDYSGVTPPVPCGTVVVHSTFKSAESTREVMALSLAHWCGSSVFGTGVWVGRKNGKTTPSATFRFEGRVGNEPPNTYTGVKRSHHKPISSHQ